MALETVTLILPLMYFPYTITSTEWFKPWSLVWPCLPGECDV